MTRPRRLRLLACLLLVAALAPGTWLRQRLPRPNEAQVLRLVPVDLPPRAALAANLGPFALEGAWRLESPHLHFGSYSALAVLGGGRLLALSDRGQALRFAAPGAPPLPPRFTPILPGQTGSKEMQDAEAATYDSATGRLWIAWEFNNMITRQSDVPGEPERVHPRAMRDWGGNSGPEAMVRLADGRFIVLREGFDGQFDDVRHRGVLFSGDPLDGARETRFTFSGPAGFSPVDLAPLPDGRVLLLMRRLVWPFPARFAGRILVADPAAIRAGGVWQGRQAALLTSSLGVDNFEGMAIEPGAGGRITVWLIADDNDAVLQRALLWKLSVDPAAL